MLRATRTASDATERVLLIALVACAAVGATLTIVLAPTLGAQVALVAAVALAILCLVAARAGHVINAAWVPIGAIYLIDVGSVFLTQVGSPVPMVTVVALAPMPFVVTALWLHPDTRRRLYLLAPLVVLLGLAALSLVWSADPDYGLRKLTLWLLTGLVPCAAMLVLASPTRPVAWRWIAVVGFVYAIVLLAIGSTALYPGRLIFFDANPIWVARAVFVAALVTIFTPLPVVAKVILIAPMLVAGYLTDSLGPAVGLVLGLGAGVAATIRLAELSRRQMVLAWSLLGVGLAIGLTVAVTVASTTSTSSLATVVNDPNVTSRALYLDLSSQLFAGSPIFGNGLGAFAALGAADLYPHNMLAEVGAELGRDRPGAAVRVVPAGPARRGTARRCWSLSSSRPRRSRCSVAASPGMPSSGSSPASRWP